MVRLVIKILFVTLLASTGMSTAASANQEQAKNEYKTALQFFEAEEFEAALPHFQKAYEVSGKRPVTILGLAQCERALKMYVEALEHFKEYLASNPPKEKAEVVKSTIALTEKLLVAQQTQAKDNPPLPKVETPPPAPKVVANDTVAQDDEGVISKPWFWVVTGLAVVGGGVGLAFALSGGSADADSGTTGVLIRP